MGMILPKWAMAQNLPPSLSHATPTPGGNYQEGMLTFTATATDPDGSIARVVFYFEGDSVGMDATAPYSFSQYCPVKEGEGEKTFFGYKAVDNVGAATELNSFVYILPNACSSNGASHGRHLICRGDSLLFSAIANEENKPKPHWYQKVGSGAWVPLVSDTLDSLWVRTAGQYRAVFTYTNMATCTTGVDTVVVDTVKGKTTINIRDSDGLAYSLCTPISGILPYAFSWQNVKNSYGIPLGDSAIIDSVNHFTIVSITDSLGCILVDTAASPSFGRTLVPLHPGSISDPPCTLVGTNLICNSSFEETNEPLAPYGGTGTNPNKMLNWGLVGSVSNDFGYISTNGLPTCSNCPIARGAFDLPCHINIENIDETVCSSASEVNPTPTGGDALFYKSVFNGPNAPKIGQKLNDGIVKGKKYLLRFSARYSRSAQFRPRYYNFYLMPSLVGGTAFDIKFQLPNDPMHLYNWKSLSTIFTVPTSNPNNFDQLALGNSGSFQGVQDSPDWWFVDINSPGDRDPDELAKYYWDFTYFDEFYLAAVPEVACAQMLKSSTAVSLGLNQNSTWLNDFVSNTGATFAWTPTTGLTNANTATPTANPSSTTTYTCKMTVDGVEYTLGSTEVKVIGPGDITFTQNICSDYVTVGNTFPSGSTFVWTKPNASTTTSGSFTISYPLTSGNSLSVVVTGNCAGNSAMVATTIPGSGLTQTDPTTLGENPRACCGTLTKIIDQSCTDDVDSDGKKDYFHSFSLSKYCGLWPSLYVSSKDCGFGVTTTFQYFNGTIWASVEGGTNEGNGKTWDFDNEGTRGIGNPLPEPAQFRIHLKSVSTSPSGNFDLKISAVEAISNGETSCESRFVSCCRVAFQPGVLEQKSLQLIISPNPAKAEFNILVASEESVAVSKDVLDMLGRPILHKQGNENEFKVSTEGIPSGVYLIRCSQGNKSVTNRLVVSK